MHRLISTLLKRRLLVLIGIVGIFIIGVDRYNKLPVDAFPDISPVMVPIFAEAHGMAPEEIERLITFPLESTMNGLPGVTQIKSTSAFGMAVIYVYFRDNVDIYFARQIVSERMTSALSKLPELPEPPALGPISTGLGQIFMYYLTLDRGIDTGGKDVNTYLREINDWVVKFQLQTVPGVTNILSIGGHVLQYQIHIDPYSLNKYGLVLQEVVEAVQKNNRNVGAQFLVLGSEEHLVRGIGLVQELSDIENIQIKAVNGIPVRVSDVAEVKYGNEIRRGVVTRNGSEEVVSGMVLQLYGENTSRVIERLYGKIPEIQKSLPRGVHIVPYYEQAELVTKATGTVKNALLMGAALVLLTLIFFLGNWRSALIVVLALPLCVLIAVIMMGFTGISANLMSLGGIAIGIGMLGDGSIVMVENIFRLLSNKSGTGRSKLEIIREAAGEVGKPIVFSIVIIISVFLPIFTLEGVEGKMFSPMALTISFALVGSIFAALVMAPVLSSYFLEAGDKKEFVVLRFMKSLFHRLLTIALRRRKTVLVVVVVAFLLSLSLIPHLGTEFVPTLDEGSILIGVTMPPSISLVKATEIVMKLERKISGFPEIKQTVSRIGRPETGSHPHPVNYAEIHIELESLDKWAGHRDKRSLISSLNSELSTYPGVLLNFTQPIQNAFDELLSGIKAQLAIKLFGEDLQILRSKANQIRNAIDNIPGLVDLNVEQSFGQPQIQVIADRSACARYGINVADMLEMVELAIGGEVIDQIYLSARRFDIHIRYQESYRNDPDAIKNLLFRASSGSMIPLEQLAEVKRVTGPIQINREKNQRRWIIQANVRGRDLGGVVADIKSRVKDKINLPPGYYIEYGGQFENQERAMARLGSIVPLVIALIFFMLYLTFDRFKNALLIIINVPLALMGGILGLYMTGEYLSVPASLGFIALFGIAVQNGVVLVAYINQLRQGGLEMDEAVIQGGLLRLRPVLMTAITTVIGLVPLLLSRGIGSEVQRPLAVVVVFGLISSTLLTLFIIPILYKWFSHDMSNLKMLEK